MNYRHAYHAGNFADVLKHAVLTLVIEHAKLKPAPFRVIDTHAGIGRYDLRTAEATTTGEWQHGIGRLLGRDAAPLPEAVAKLLAPYLDLVRAENADGRLHYYPGSPLVARRLLRPDDRLIAAELHPQDFAELDRLFARDVQAKAVKMDGWQALKAFLPPPERRGIILIDPPYEVPHELERIVAALATAHRKFRGGTLLAWYPIKDVALIERMHDAVVALEIPKIMRAELFIRSRADTTRLNGCGLMIVNPPWTLPEALDAILPFLAERLGLDEHNGRSLQWIRE